MGTCLLEGAPAEAGWSEGTAVQGADVLLVTFASAESSPWDAGQHQSSVSDPPPGPLRMQYFLNQTFLGCVS